MGTVSMETDEQIVPQGSSLVVSNAPNSSGLTVALHPLALLNISDHYTRIKMQQQVSHPRVIGALLGTQSGREVEITNSYELVHVESDGKIIVSEDYFTNKQEQ
ncbi:3859_t:CDS:2, partial [Paraglomus occultum]